MDSVDIPQDVFAERRRRLARSLKVDTVIISAHIQLQKSRDEVYPFMQETNFLYLTGINEPGWVLVMDLKKGKEWLIQPKREMVHALFYGSFEAERVIARSGVEQVLENRQGWQAVKELKTKKIGVLLPSPSYIQIYEMFTNPTRRMVLQKVKRLHPDAKYESVGEAISAMRRVKDKYEQKLIQNAIDITGAVLNPIMKNIGMYKYEYEIEADVAYGFRKHQAKEGYHSIIAAGKNTTQLHYNTYGGKIAKNDMILFDIGAMKDNYMADISRTLPHGGVFSPRQVEIYAAVLDTMEFAFSLLKPGITHREYETEVEQYIGDHMLRLGIIKNLKRKSIRYYFPSYTSHGLGLDVHDSLGLDDPLEPGVIMTVEPGIYIPEEGIGVRIEDEVMITKSGMVNMSENIHKIII